MRAYYEAYDDRYRQIHAMNLTWEDEAPSPIVEEVIERYQLTKTSRILEIGCGEGRDAGYLLKMGYQVHASDISPEAVSFCRRKWLEFADSFHVLNACKDKLNQQFDFLYSIAVLHMLVLDEDRDRFLTFLRDHLAENGIGLVLSMGDGETEFATSIEDAFSLRQRTHMVTGNTVSVAATSCRMVSLHTLEQECSRNGLVVLEKGITSVNPGFPEILYVIVKKR